MKNMDVLAKGIENVERVKLTKTELRSEELKLKRLQTYLPTLQLKKAMLQAEVSEAQALISALSQQFETTVERAKGFSVLLSDLRAGDLFASIDIEKVVVKTENIAGIDTPVYEQVIFTASSYALFDTPLWIDSAVAVLRQLIELREHVRTVKEKKRLLEEELKAVSIRVNLFEKIMIPRISSTIKRIKIFLGDQQLASIAQAKVAKQKILGVS